MTELSDDEIRRRVDDILSNKHIEEPVPTIVTEYEEALEWIANLVNGVGKAGGSPAPGEWEDAFRNVITVLEKYKK